MADGVADGLAQDRDGGERGRGHSKSYDAFISYSHDADRDFAPALQDGMQRLAKPWLRKRAIEVYRDETSMAANPDLWGTIEAALDASDWFVLLASPKAAESYYVGKEIRHAMETKGPARIVVVVTSGKVAWDDEAGGFTEDSDAVHPVMRQLFDTAPVIVDMEWAHGEVDLTLRNAIFRDQVAHIVAPIHGDTSTALLRRDVVVQRRRTRAVGVAVAALAVLAVGAGAASVRAAGNQREATAQQETAEEQATLAEERAAIAEEQRAVAESEARIARSRELAAIAVDLDEAYRTPTVGGEDAQDVEQPRPALPMLVAVEAFTTASTQEANGALLQVLAGSGVDAGLVDPPQQAPGPLATPDISAVARGGERAITTQGIVVDATGSPVDAAATPLAVRGPVAFNNAGTHAAFVLDEQRVLTAQGNPAASDIVVVELATGSARVVRGDEPLCTFCDELTLALADDAATVFVRPFTIALGGGLRDGSDLLRLDVGGDRVVLGQEVRLDGPGFARMRDDGEMLHIADGGVARLLEPMTLREEGVPTAVSGLQDWEFVSDGRAMAVTDTCVAAWIDGTTMAVVAEVPAMASFLETGCEAGPVEWDATGTALLVGPRGAAEMWPTDGSTLMAMACQSLGERALTAEEVVQFGIEASAGCDSVAAGTGDPGGMGDPGAPAVTVEPGEEPS